MPFSKPGQKFVWDQLQSQNWGQARFCSMPKWMLWVLWPSDKCMHLCTDDDSTDLLMMEISIYSEWWLWLRANLPSWETPITLIQKFTAALSEIWENCRIINKMIENNQIHCYRVSMESACFLWNSILIIFPVNWKN